jgi:hypothetical protein
MAPRQSMAPRSRPYASKRSWPMAAALNPGWSRHPARRPSPVAVRYLPNTDRGESITPGCAPKRRLFRLPGRYP